MVSSGATTLMINSPNNVYIGKSFSPSCKSYLTIRRRKHR
jgi:hypothetical protein